MTDLEKHLTKTNDILLNQIEKLTSQTEIQTQEIKRLSEQIQYLTKKLYGKSSEKSAKTSDEQLSLFEDFFDNAETTAPQTVEEEITYRRKKKKGHRAELLKNLPEEIIHCELSDSERACSECGDLMKPMGTKKVREELHFIPAKLYKKVFVTHTYACDCHDDSCESKNIKCATAPQGPIQNSYPGASVLAQVFHLKYEMSIPTYRQTNEWKMYGLNVNRNTLSNWLIVASRDWITPIYKEIHKQLLMNQVLHGDETPYQILNRSDGKPATSEARIWAFRTTQSSEKPIIFYYASLTRSRQVAEKVLNDFSGYLHCDGYSGYKNLKNITLVGCWAHLRRYLKDASMNSENSKGKIGVDYCNKLFSLERKFKLLTPEERFEKRQLESKPIVEEFYEWLGSFYTMKGKLQTAVTYAINQKQELTRFLEDGHLQLSNNLMEEKIRPIAIGRKNYLFSTSEQGATTNAMVYTIIETAKENKINVSKYLTYLFEKLPNLNFHQNSDLLQEFLPWSKNVKELCT